MNRRVQDFPAVVRQLGTLGQIWIIESLPLGDLRTGLHLSEAVRDAVNAHNLPIQVFFRVVESRDALLAVIDHIHAETAAHGRSVLLHIECHGSNDLTGLVLGNESYVGWLDLKPRLRDINLACGFNLFLVLACCNGAWFLETTSLDECSAFCACLGPHQEVGAGLLERGFVAFYRSLLIEHDVNDALTAAIAVAPDFPYYYTSAEGLFRNVFEHYINQLATGEALRARAERVLQAQRARGRTDLASVDQMAQELIDREPAYFTRFLRTFFAIDQIPENEARYPLTYADVVPMAHRAIRGLVVRT